MASDSKKLDTGLVRELAAILREADLGEIEVEIGEMRIHVAKAQAPAQTVAAPVQMAAPPVAAPVAAAPAAAPSAPAGGEPQVAANEKLITSPMVGTFYRKPSPDAANFTDKGQTVSPTSTVCIIEAMKVMNEIKAELSGMIVDVLVEDGEPVEFGQPLFKVTTG